MKKFRIKEYDYGTYTEYEVQKKFLNLFWYNPIADSYTTGFFDSIEEAEKCIQNTNLPPKTKIVKKINI